MVAVRPVAVVFVVAVGVVLLLVVGFAWTLLRRDER